MLRLKFKFLIKVCPATTAEYSRTQSLLVAVFNYWSALAPTNQTKIILNLFLATIEALYVTMSICQSVRLQRVSKIVKILKTEEKA